MKTKFKQFTIMFLTLIVASTFYTSCNPSENGNPTDDSGFSNNFGNEVTKDFIGRVVDINNNPISSVSIKIGTSTALTDGNGIFIINGAGVYEKFAYITAKKSGYIDGSRSLVPTTGKNTVNIMLLSSAPTSTVNSGVASEVLLTSGTKVNFDGAFQDESGASYSGAIQVSLHELKPSNTDINKIMPGMLYARGSDGNPKVLETFGMMNVELRGSGGQKLQIASGHTAQITMDIDSSQLATAPSSLPLWHFDEEKGYWKQDGTATKTGNKYVGTVSHFSWWNCDYPFDQCTLSVKVVDPTGAPVNNVRVEIIQAGSIWPGQGYSNSSGQVNGIVPANESLTIKAYDNCGTVIYTSAIGPFVTNSSNVLPNIVLPAIIITSVNGSLKKCDATNVTNGYLFMNDGLNSNFTAITNGNFEFNSLVCSAGSTFTLQGYDYDSFQTTGVLTYAYSTPNTNIGNIFACTAVNEFISYQVDSNPIHYVISSITASYSSSVGSLGLSISGSNPGENGIYIWSSDNTVGSYTTSIFSMEGGEFGYIANTVTNNVVFNLNNYGAVGEYIDLTFNGSYNDNNGTSHTITGTVHVLRDN